MGNRYKFTLGYKRTSGDLLTGITPVRNTFTNGFYQSWLDVVVPGKIYEAEFEQIGTSDVALGLGIGLGYFGSIAGGGLSDPLKGFISRWFPDANGFYSYRNICLDGTDFLLAGIGPTRDGQNFELYELGWNDPLNIIPMNWDNAKLELKRDAQDFAQMEKYSTTLNFVGDGFDYLRDTLLTEGRGAIVPVKIEKLADWCSPYSSNLIYEVIYEGAIYLNKAIFDYPRRTIEAALEDISPSSVLSNGKDIAVDIANSYSSATNTWPQYFFLPTYGFVANCELHDTLGNYPVNKKHPLLIVIDSLRAIIKSISEGGVDFRSDYFSSNYPYLMFTRGDQLFDFNYENIQLSFGDIFNQLDKIFNLGISFEKDGNIPIIRIEPKGYYNSLAGVPVVLSDIKEINISAPSEINYRILDIGYKFKWNPVDETNSDIGDILHYSSGNIADGVHLDLVSGLIADGNYIQYALEQAVGSDSADIDDKFILFECALVSGNIKSTQVTPTEYNHTLHPVDSLNRWKTSLPEEIFGAPHKDRDVGEEFRNRLIKLSAPITMKDFNKLINPTAKVRLVNPAKNKALIDGIAMSVSRSMKTGIADIEILTS